MYPWATKEYLLWEMTIGQIIFYYNKGISIKNGEKDNVELDGDNLEELKKIREQMREDYRKQYGDV